MIEKETFFNIDDELNWYAFVMSEGNFEAASTFVGARNKYREKIKKNTRERNV